MIITGNDSCDLCSQILNSEIKYERNILLNNNIKKYEVINIL
jgi:hypothetical protein